jgi:hypothetical protein
MEHSSSKSGKLKEGDLKLDQLCSVAKSPGEHRHWSGRQPHFDAVKQLINAFILYFVPRIFEFKFSLLWFFPIFHHILRRSRRLLRPNLP